MSSIFKEDRDLELMKTTVSAEMKWDCWKNENTVAFLNSKRGRNVVYKCEVSLLKQERQKHQIDFFKLCSWLEIKYKCVATSMFSKILMSRKTKA